MHGYARQARVFSLQLLYQYHISQEWSGQHTLDEFWAGHKPSRKTIQLTKKIVSSALDNLKAIDQTIARCLTNHNLERLDILVQCILRIGIAELSFLKTPHHVVLSEAVDLAAEFVDFRAARLINALLQQYWDSEELALDEHHNHSQPR